MSEQEWSVLAGWARVTVKSLTTASLSDAQAAREALALLDRLAALEAALEEATKSPPGQGK